MRPVIMFGPAGRDAQKKQLADARRGMRSAGMAIEDSQNPFEVLGAHLRALQGEKIVEQVD